MSRARKLSNSYGSIQKLSGNRRRPYVVRITKKWEENETGDVKQYRPILGYCKTRTEALELLANYNQNPYNLDNRKKTFAEVYSEWSQVKFKTISSGNINSYKASFKYCESLHNRYFSELKHKDFQSVIDTCGKNYPTLRKIKFLLNQLCAYAVQNEYCSSDRSLHINITQYINKKPNKLTRTIFSEEEINTLWNFSNERYIQTILVLIYTGLRVSEFYNIKNVDVNLKEKYINITSSKTESGVRVVPIADKIYPYVESFYNDNYEYLFHTLEGKKLTDNNYRNTYWQPAMNLLKMNHLPHDTRHTCISLMAKNGISDTLIKTIVGHRSTMSITQRVYTHLDIKELLDAINKI